MIATLFFFMSCSFGLDYAQIFGADYQKALLFCTNNNALINEKTAHYKLPTDELMAIVFPELIRHSAFRDLLETKALSIAYVSQGSSVADFSIGSFQMKPSFVEKLEEAIQNNAQLRETFKQLINYPNTTKTKQRSIRLERLQNKNWQLDYLCCFYQLMKYKFKPELSALKNKERIQFLAAAYNAGFDQSFDAIQQWTTRACYPYGVQYPADQQYVYADIAWDYYKRKNP